MSELRILRDRSGRIQFFEYKEQFRNRRRIGWARISRAKAKKKLSTYELVTRETNCPDRSSWSSQ